VAGDAKGVGADADTWVYALASGSLSRLTFDGRAYSLWSPDGRRIASQDPRRASLVVKPADGARAEENLFPPGPDPLLPSSWSPDGRTLALTRLGPVTEIQLLTLGEKPRPFETDASTPAFSPDGRWIAYQSPASGASDVYVRAVDGEGKWQISTART